MEDKNIEVKEKETEMSTDELIKIISEGGSKKEDLTYLVNPMIIDLKDCRDSTGLAEGIELGLKYAGVYTALVSAGMSIEFSEQTVSSMMLIEKQNEKCTDDAIIRDQESAVM